MAEGSPESCGKPDGDRERFERLSKLHSARARKYVQLKLGAALRRRVDSDDVLQEVLLEASRLFLKGEAGGDLSDEEFFSWLARIVDNKIKNLARFHVKAKRRSVRREVHLDSGDGQGTPRAGDKTPSAEMIAIERWDRVQEAIRELPPREREVIALVYFEKLRIAEAAQRLGKTPSSTSVLLCQAHNRLREILRRRER